MIINKEEAKRFNLENLDFWYDLTDGGYLDPDTILDELSAKRVKKAVEVLREFEDELTAALADMEDEE